MEMTIHEYIKQIRIDQMLSIQDLSKKSQVSASHISRIERANRNPSPETLEKLAPHLNIAYTTLLEVANLLEKKEKQVIHLEDVLNHSKLFLHGEIIEERIRKLLIKTAVG